MQKSEGWQYPEVFLLIWTAIKAFTEAEVRNWGSASFSVYNIPDFTDIGQGDCFSIFDL